MNSTSNTPLTKLCDEDEDLKLQIAAQLKPKVITKNASSNINKSEVLSPQTKIANLEDYINGVNANFLGDVLAPELTKNEQTKREHKDRLLTYASVFISVQFLGVGVMVWYFFNSVVTCHKVGNPFSNETISILVNFMCAYITSVVVELIAILRYIVHNVFDQSISSLVKAFRNKNKNKK